ncbi:elongation factor P [Candidatus Kaiserbacteria bacterium CG10_big_fil_rev_8_21_14_0_10_43_70]|uniref:Elongation factor P n=1 Tax=Candidatus Kaiserbacteria bacterium CG10_big_fil_rev_8_21_14_0_10_43_70 TaxID=1974605 RepID=A0A2H0UIS4_9BACT|nr:MAG: elongation factor P [Candidatus Kaiserbacteria bacterium CG10_big_fil_rev_8_21_14_0_10_43_70]
MLSYAEITPKRVIIFDGDPYEVIATSGIVKKQRQKPHNTAKMKNLRTGSTVEKTFTQSDKIEEAELETIEMKYLFTNRGESWLSDPKNPSYRKSVSESLMDDQLPYLRENDLVEVLSFEENILGIRIPIKVDLKVVEAPPNVKGNTAQGGVKPVVLETGLTVTVPMFIKDGDVVRVNTDTGEYVERV